MIRDRYKHTSGLLISAMTNNEFDMYFKLLSNEHKPDRVRPNVLVGAAAYYALEVRHSYTPPPKEEFFINFWKDDRALLDQMGYVAPHYIEAVAAKPSCGMALLRTAYEMEVRQNVQDRKRDPAVRRQPEDAFDYPEDNKKAKE